MSKAKYTPVNPSDVEGLTTIPHFSRYAADRKGNLYSKDYKGSGQMVRIKPANCGGYYRTMLLGDDGKYHTVKIHRLICMTFLGESSLEVNHKDGNGLNNSLENLEYCTHSENLKHAFSMGLEKPLKGENNPTSKLTDKEVEEIRAYAAMMKAQGKRYYGAKELAEKYGVSRGYIKELVRRRRNLRS